MIHESELDLPIDTPEGRVTALAGSLYYVAQLAHGYETERHFSALSHVDQLFFESLVRLALEASAAWRTHEDRVAVTMPSRPALALVRPLSRSIDNAS